MITPELVHVEIEKGEPKISIVHGTLDDSWTPFWLMVNVATMSKNEIVDAVSSTLARAMAHFNVEKPEGLEMLEQQGIRVAHPYRPDGTRIDDFVFFIRKRK